MDLMAPGLIQIAGSTPHLHLRTAAMNQTLATLGLSGLLMLTTQARPQDGGTLVDLAVGAGEFTTLVAAVDRGLAPGPTRTAMRSSADKGALVTGHKPVSCSSFSGFRANVSGGRRSARRGRRFGGREKRPDGEPRRNPRMNLHPRDMRICLLFWLLIYGT